MAGQYVAWSHRRRQRLDHSFARTSNRGRRRRRLRRRATSGRSPLPVARQHASDAAHRLCVSESLSSILWRHGQKYCCLVGWNSVSDWRRELSSKLKKAPLANLSTLSKPTLRSSRCRRKTVRLNLYVKGNF